MTSKYPLISDYGYIADCHTAALVSRSGCIDWCCVPRFDSGSCFGRLLDWDKGGHCSVRPQGDFASRREYSGPGLILVTTFETATGTANLTDFFSMRHGGKHDPRRDINRILECTEGEVSFVVEVAARFDYGGVKPWIRAESEQLFSVVGGDDGLLIWNNLGLAMEHRHDLAAEVTLEAGEKRHLWMQFRKPELLDEGDTDACNADDIDARLEETSKWWQDWAGEETYEGDHEDLALRSASVLKGMTNAPTGAVCAAVTTSLPETPGGSRNWDYRYSWIRDSAFTARSLAELGHQAEADGFRRFIERTAAGSADELQIMFGIGGERRLVEEELGDLEGYAGAKPVRIGNSAQSQLQLDMYGELVELARRWHDRGHSPDDDYWEFIVETVSAAARLWHKPDQGLWEMRGEPQHFVHSKVMCWAALNDGITMAADLGRRAPTSRWEKARKECYEAIRENGYDTERATYVQAFGSAELDAAILLLPSTGFIAYDDERMISTTNAIWKGLGRDGLLLRYREESDGMEGAEGAFLSCSFWLVECLAGQGRLEEAREVFGRAAGTANDLLLLSEEYDVKTEQMLGNYPQALTHLSLITAIAALRRAASKS